MSRWFRFYDDVINDPKVLRLPEAIRWSWVAVLCIASKHGGTLPKMADTAFLMRINLKKANSTIAALVDAGLLDKTEDSFSPHNWGGRQFLSDGSAERVRRHREKRAAAGLEAQWFAPKALRKEVYARDNHECVYCGSADNLSLDHKTPESRGGTHDISNLQTACMKCNGTKRDFTHEEFVTRNGGVTLQKRPQSTETETHSKTEQKDSEANASGADAPIDHRKRLFNEGLSKLATMTGKGPDACRSFVGKCLKAASDDAITVLGLIEDAERNQAVDPCAWIASRLKTGPSSTAKPLTEFQRKQAETNDVTSQLRAYAHSSGSGGNTDRILSNDTGQQSSDLRGGPRATVLALSGASSRRGN